MNCFGCSFPNIIPLVCRYLDTLLKVLGSTDYNTFTREHRTPLLYHLRGVCLHLNLELDVHIHVKLCHTYWEYSYYNWFYLICVFCECILSFRPWKFDDTILSPKTKGRLLLFPPRRPRDQPLLTFPARQPSETRFSYSVCAY